MKTYLIVAALCCASFAQANNGATELYQQEPLQSTKLSKEQWQKSIEGLSYKTVPKPEPEPNLPNQPNQPRRRSGISQLNPPNLSFGETWGRTLVVGSVVLMLGFILFRVLAKLNDEPVAVRQPIINVEDIEKNIHEADIDRFLREALEASNYRLAVRLYYLAIIKELSLKGKISWKRDKTNGAYLKEMRKNSQLYPDFSRLTLVFEYVWYSNSHFSKDNYQQVQADFSAFLKQI